MIGLLLVVSLAYGCVEAPTQEPAVPAPGTYPVDPVFREYYAYLGGAERLGKAIAPSRKEGSATTQFTENGEMIFDSTAPASTKFRMASLGETMGVKEPTVPKPDNPEVYYVDGHTIPPDFYLVYEELGASTVGKPLTEPRLNMIRKRYEQYFENLGFYRIEGTSEVHLLSYGTWVCQDKCLTNQTSGDAIIDIRSYIDPAFQGFVREYGADFTGFALTGGYQSGDGKWEQILENTVLFADARVNPTQVGFRPLTDKLHIPADAPRLPSGQPDMYFYATQGDDKGYEIPLFFWRYISEHGGIPLIGPPISHYGPLMDEIYHQCFTRLCLSYDPSAANGARVRPEPLGYAYKVLYYYPPETQAPTPASTVTAPPTFTATPSQEIHPSPQLQAGGREISLRVWQRYLVMEQKQGQEIDIWVEENGQPLVGKVVGLTVKTPDGGDQFFEMPPTDESGQSILLLPEIKALNGTIIPFKACYAALEDLKVCVADIFVIWNTP